MPDVRRDVEELFEVFDPWTELESVPWEPPARAPRPVPPSPVAVPHVNAHGALEHAAVIQAPPSMQQGRRRVGPRIAPPVPVIPTPDPARAPAAFLREVALPEIAGAARRLEAMEHQLQVQDLLDLPDPALRVLFWPQPGPMALSPERTRATLEFTVRPSEPAKVVARTWNGKGPTEHTLLGQVPLTDLELDWVTGQLMTFIEDVLAKA